MLLTPVQFGLVAYSIGMLASSVTVYKELIKNPDSAMAKELDEELDYFPPHMYKMLFIIAVLVDVIAWPLMLRDYYKKDNDSDGA